MDSKIKKVTAGQVLGRALKVLVDEGICQPNAVLDWSKVLIYLHKKGWLYVGIDKKGIVHTVTCCYRIPNTLEMTLQKLPEKELGDILFIPFYATSKKEKMTAKRMLKAYGSQRPISKVLIRKSMVEKKMQRISVKGGA